MKMKDDKYKKGIEELVKQYNKLTQQEQAIKQQKTKITLEISKLQGKVELCAEINSIETSEVEEDGLDKETPE